MSLSPEYINTVTALRKGTHISWVDFLKSQATAHQVADKVWEHLASNGFESWQRAEVIIVKRSDHLSGSWKVEVRLPGFDLTQQQVSDTANHARAAAVAALQASYSTADLVPSLPW